MKPDSPHFLQCFASFEKQPEGMVLLDENRKPVRMNAAGLRMVGVDSVEQAQNCAFESWVAEEHRQDFRDLVERVFGGAAGTLEFHFNGPKGKQRAEISVSPLAENGNAVACLGIVRALNHAGERRQLEQALNDSEAKFRAIFEASNDGIFLHRIVQHGERVDFVLCDVNPKACELCGCSREEILAGKFNLLAAGDPPRTSEESTRRLHLAAAGQPQIFDWRFKRGDGSAVWGEFNLRCIRICGEEFLMATVRDITDRKRMEHALHTREEEFWTLAENSPDVIIRYDLNGRRVYFNQAFAARAELAGRMSPRELLGRDPAEACVSSSDVGQKSLEAIQKVIREAAPVEFEMPVPDIHGDIHNYDLRFIPEFGADGKIAGVLNIGRCVTPEEVERQLRWKREQEFRSLAENCPDIIVRYDRQCRRTYVNPAYERINGISAGEVLGKTPTEFSSSATVAGKTAALIEGKVAQVIECCQRIRIDIGWLDSSGQPVSLEMLLVPEFEANGSVGSVLTICRDVSELRKAMRKLALKDFALSHVGEGMYLVDEDGRFLDVNEASCRMLGYNREELLNLGVRGIDPKFDSVEKWKSCWQEIAHLRLKTVETRHRAKDGRFIEVEINASYIEFEGNSYHLTFVRDITERKRVAEALENAAMRLNEAQRLAHIGSWELDLRTNVLAWSDEIYRIFEMDPAKFGASYEAFLNAIHPDDREAVNLAYASSLKNRTPYDIDHRLRFPDGRIKFVREQCETVYENDKPVRSLGTIQDITERKRTELALRENEARYRALYTGTPAMLHSIDREGRLISVSDCWLATMGYTREEVLGRKSTEFLTETSRRYAAEIVLPEFMRTGQCRDIEYQFVRKDGEIINCLLSAIAERDADGQLLRSLAVVTDITERKRLETQLRKLSQVVEQSPLSIVITDLRGSIEYVNPRFTKLTGYSLSEARGQNPRILKSGEQPAEFYRDLWGQISAGREWTGEFHNRKKNGEFFWEQAVISPIHDAQGALTHFLAIKEDITERKRTEEALRESEEKFRLMAATARDGIITMDGGGKVSFWNRAAEEMLGYSSAEALNQELHRLVAPQRFHAAHHKGFHHFQNTGEGVVAGKTLELVARRKDGVEIPVELSVSSLKLKGQWHALGIIRDLTERKSLEEQLRQKQKMEAVGQLAGGIAHDFNNILSAIIMQTDILKMDEGLSQESREGVDDVCANAERAAKLTRQLLMFSRKQLMQQRGLNLNEVITNFTKMLRRVIREDVHLQLSLHPLPLMVHGDEGMLEQVLMNLAANASDAMPGGGQLLIETSEKFVNAAMAQANRELEPGRYAVLTISDTGAGIPPEILPRIFDPFFTTKDVGKGTGLGLATVFGIVKQHRGTVTVTSSVSLGSHFQILLPVSGDGSAEPADPAPAYGELLGGSESILLVEDEPSVRATISKILQRCGYQVLEAVNGVEACDMWRTRRSQVALLLTDLIMPGGINGRELAERFRADKPDLKIIFISGYSKEIAGKEVSRLDGGEFLTKPFMPRQLMETIRRVLDQKNEPDTKSAKQPR